MIINISNCNISKNSSEDQFLYNCVARRICRYNRLLLSYSGGLDSTVLLDILSTLVKCSNPLIKLIPPFFLRAVYVDHGFSINSVKWSDHCAQQCKIRNIPFRVLQIGCRNFRKKSGNIEARARILRYKVLCDHLNLEETLLTAHHMDDQVETLLLALKRGSGPAGLSGISENIVLYGNHRLLRPLLECSRDQLESYAHRKKLTWIEDDTNTNIRFDRNFLRIQVIPLLKKRWPSFNIVVKRTAQLCRNQENLLKELLLESLNNLVDADGSLFYYPLFKFSLVKRYALLRFWLSNFFVNMPSCQLLCRIWQEVILSKPGSKPILNLGKYVCSRFHKKLYILPIDMTSMINSFPLYWNLLNHVILLPYKLGLLIYQKLTINVSEYYFKKSLEKHNIDSINSITNIYLNHYKTSGKILTDCIVRAPKIDEKVSIRFGHVNGLLYVLNRNHGRKLKKIWQELCIPPWLRNRIPLLFYNNTLIAAIGIFITQDGNATRIEDVANNRYSIVWKISWIQDISYYNFFKNTIYRYC